MSLFGHIENEEAIQEFFSEQLTQRSQMSDVLEKKLQEKLEQQQYDDKISNPKEYFTNLILTANQFRDAVEGQDRDYVADLLESLAIENLSLKKQMTHIYRLLLLAGIKEGGTEFEKLKEEMDKHHKRIQNIEESKIIKHLERNLQDKAKDTTND